jgi:hypothetical protein
MKAKVKPRAGILLAGVIFLLYIYGFMQFGVTLMLLGVLSVAVSLYFFYMGKITPLYVLNTLSGLTLVAISFASKESLLVNTDAACLDVCIGNNLPILLIRILSVILFSITVAVLLRWFVEKK